MDLAKFFGVGIVGFTAINKVATSRGIPIATLQTRDNHYNMDALVLQFKDNRYRIAYVLAGVGGEDPLTLDYKSNRLLIQFIEDVLRVDRAKQLFLRRRATGYST